jgi:hypothetical protein
MQRALLTNPFSPVAEVSRRIDDHSSRVERSTPVCSNCGSDDILCHATIQWSNESQEWQLTGSFEQAAHCNNCHGSCCVTWLKLA